MKRRNFLQLSTIGAFGIGAINSAGPLAQAVPITRRQLQKTAKNIIFLVSDGMSAGTLQLAELCANVKLGHTTAWVDLYRQNRVVRALMDTASANSFVTDSAAASSSWGGGVRVNNGALNTGPNGELYRPILQKFKATGKSVGCVTSVPITHATPAGFCVNQTKRDAQPEIAQDYLDLRFDCLLGGGREYFSASQRSDKRDLFAEFRAAGFHVATQREHLNNSPADQPVLGVFYESGIPFAVDHEQDTDLKTNVPTLAEMARFAIQKLSSNPDGFVLQVEGGKVDWAAHANDAPGLIFDQLAFDEAVREAIKFAEQDGDTLLIITTDHGNANPGLLGTSGANKKFEKLIAACHSNHWIMSGLRKNWAVDEVRQRIQYAQGLEISAEEAQSLHDHIEALTESERGEAKKLPYAKLAQIQSKYTGIGWAGDDHSGDFVELAMLGPGSELLSPFVKNTDLHTLMLQATGLPTIES